MYKAEFFKLAMQNGAFKKRAWTISCFSVISEEMNAWKKNPYPYRVVQTPTAVFFVNPDDNYQLTKLDECKPNEPPFTFLHGLELHAGDFPNVKKTIITTYGNVFFNCCCIVHAFDDKLDFFEGRVSVSQVENAIVDRLVSNDITDPKFITVNEYLKFVNAVMFLTNFTQLCVWAATAKSMTPPPGLKQFKAELLEKFKGKLTDPAIIAQIDAELVKFDAEYLKGDPSENFLISKKSRQVVRKKLFLMAGAEAGLTDGVAVDLIQNSLVEGWEISKFAQMNNTLRAGSYNRGAQTELGGVSVKTLLRASSNITATIEDCGSIMGRKQFVQDDNFKRLVNLSIVTDTGPLLITSAEEAGKYLGKTVIVRSPMFCKLSKTDYCLTCVGKRLARNPMAISMAVSAYGSVFLNLFMKKMHGTTLSLAKYDYKSSIT